MIDRCANSRCEKTLHYFREGIIYAVESSMGKSGLYVEHFWLCGECAKSIMRDDRAGARWRPEETSNLKPWPPLQKVEKAISIAS